MKHLRLISFSALCLLQAATAELELRGSPDELARHFAAERETIVLSGSATQTVEATGIEMTIRIQVEDRSVTASLERHDKAKRDFIDTLIRSGGLERGDMKVSRYADVAEFDKPIRAVASSSFTVRVKTQSHYLAINELIEREETASLAGTEFDHELAEQIHELVFTKACNEVKKRKRALETNLGLVLTPLSVKEVDHQQRHSGFGQIVLESAVDVTYAVEPGDDVGELPVADALSEPDAE